MALPRETIIQAIRTRLLDIAVADGFNNDVVTVTIGFEPPHSLNRSDFPLILIEPGPDRDVRETEGAGTDNRYHRAWEMLIGGILWPPGSDEEVRLAGELFLDDIVKRLTTEKTFDVAATTAAVGFVMSEIQPADIFEVRQTKLAWVQVLLTVTYAFKPSGI